MAGDATENVFNVIDAFTVPRLAYSVDRKKFLPDSMPAKVFAGNVFFLPRCCIQVLVLTCHPEES